MNINDGKINKVLNILIIVLGIIHFSIRYLEINNININLDIKNIKDYIFYMVLSILFIKLIIQKRNK